MAKQVIAYQAHDGNLFVDRDEADRYDTVYFLGEFHNAFDESNAFFVLKALHDGDKGPGNAQVIEFVVRMAKKRGIVASLFNIFEEEYKALMVGQPSFAEGADIEIVDTPAPVAFDDGGLHHDGVEF